MLNEVIFVENPQSTFSVLSDNALWDQLSLLPLWTDSVLVTGSRLRICQSRLQFASVTMKDSRRRRWQSQWHTRFQIATHETKRITDELKPQRLTTEAQRIHLIAVAQKNEQRRPITPANDKLCVSIPRLHADPIESNQPLSEPLMLNRLNAALLCAATLLPCTQLQAQNEPKPDEALKQLGDFLLGKPVAREAKKQVSEDEDPTRVALFNLSGALGEKPAAQDDIFMTQAGESLASLTKRMRQAADDKNIAAIVVVHSGIALGRAQAEEVIEALQYAKAAGKPVWAYADALMFGGYTILAQADRLSVSPEGAVIATGLYGGQMYLKGLLDKIGVEPDFIAIGDYKAAGETFTRTGPSDFARQNLNWLFDSLYASMLEQVAAGRGVDVAKAEEWIDEGVYSGTEAVSDGLVDAAETREQMVAALEEKLGGTVKFERRYGKSSGKTIDLSSPFGVMNFYAELLGGPKSTKITKPTVAIVHVNGAIMDGSPTASPFGVAEGAFSQPIRKALLDAAEEDMVKAVVLRVDSPGGSAIASEVILQAAKIVADKKPLIVSMGNVAASGGYYVSMAAEKIFADATTITGSIGVVSGKMATKGMWDKVGIEFVPFARGKNADLFSSDNEWTDAQEEELTQWMLDAYKTFTGHVTANRGDKLDKPMDELAGGRVYSGAQALELGLVDEIGSLYSAITYAAEKAGLKDGKYELQAIPRPKSLIEMMAMDMQPKKDSHPNRLQMSIFDAALPLIENLDPVKAKAVKQALMQLDVLRQNRVALIAPVILTE